MPDWINGPPPAEVVEKHEKQDGLWLRKRESGLCLVWLREYLEALSKFSTTRVQKAQTEFENQQLLAERAERAKKDRRIVELLDGVNYAYQLAGVARAGVDALDNLSALSRGKTPPHRWPVAASSEIDRLEAENVRLTQANRIATDITLQAINRANVAEKALAEARAALVEIATSSRSSGESALARAALDAARKDEKDD